MWSTMIECGLWAGPSMGCSIGRIHGPSAPSMHSTRSIFALSSESLTLALSCLTMTMSGPIRHLLLSSPFRLHPRM
jgi:hypothetical protein